MVTKPGVRKRASSEFTEPTSPWTGMSASETAYALAFVQCLCTTGLKPQLGRSALIPHENLTAFNA